MIVKWKQLSKTLWIGSVNGIEQWGVSINVDTMKYILLDLSAKPQISLATNKEFDTAESAKRAASAAVTCASIMLDI